MTKSSEQAVSEILAELRKIPKEIKTTINMKELSQEVSKILKKQINSRISSGL